MNPVWFTGVKWVSTEKNPKGGMFVKQRKNLRHPLSLALALMLSVVLLAGCGGSRATASYDVAPQAMPAASSAAAMEGGGFAGAPEYDKGAAENSVATDGNGDIEQPPSAPESLGRKIIKEGAAEIEALEYEKAVNGLYDLVTSLGGFVESQTMQGNRYYQSSLRSASITVRVPAEKFDEAMYRLSNLGSVVRQDSSGTDITDSYADTEARVRNLKIQETRILELIAKAQKLDEIVTLESRLSDLRYQIESLENSLKNYDRLLAFSRISLTITEVLRESDVKPMPKTLGERIAQAFDDAWTGLRENAQDFLVWLIANMFGLIFLALIVFIAWRIIRHANRKRKEAERTARAEREEEAQRRGMVPPGYPPAWQQPPYPQPPYGQPAGNAMPNTSTGNGQVPKSTASGEPMQSAASEADQGEKNQQAQDGETTKPADGGK